MADKPNRVSKTFRLDPETPARLASIANRLGKSQGQLIDFMTKKFENAKVKVVLGK